MTVSELQSLINKSPILTADDKTYWLGVLATMKPEHYAKLENILTKGASLASL